MIRLLEKSPHNVDHLMWLDNVAGLQRDNWDSGYFAQLCSCIHCCTSVALEEWLFLPILSVYKRRQFYPHCGLVKRQLVFGFYRPCLVEEWGLYRNCGLQPHTLESSLSATCGALTLYILADDIPTRKHVIMVHFICKSNMIIIFSDSANIPLNLYYTSLTM